MTRIARLLVVLLALAARDAYAQTSGGTKKPADIPSGDRDNGTRAATILQMGVAPRAVALGEAMGAVSGDPTSIWYNAAGIALIKTNSFMVTGSQRFADTQLAAAAVTFPTALGTFGIGARAFNAGTIEITENSAVLGRARAYQLALEGGGALQLTSHWLWGGSLFYAQETLGDESRSTIGVNSGMMFPDIFGRLTLGGGVRNWGTPVTFDVISARPPMVFYGAGSVDLLRRRNLIATPLLFRGESLVLDAKAVAQADVPDQGEMFLRGGIEGTLNGVAIGRIGYQWGDDNRRGLSLGAGINVGQFRLEYAFRNRANTGASFFSDDVIGDEHHVGATYFWGKSESNVPASPVLIAAPIDTASINAAVRGAIAEQLSQLRPLLDSLRSSRVEIRQESELVSSYVVPIHFGFDSAAVRDSDLVVLGQVARVIREVYPTALVTVSGFADPSGSEQYNLALSRRRADAVRNVLVARFGLPPARLRAVGYGESPARQVSPGARAGEPGAEANRRVTFTIDATRRF